ncbi:MAG: DNA recombination protein RmuC [Treponema sp.]|nr:DNA recombination protein RmuC [Treponema sp.]
MEKQFFYIISAGLALIILLLIILLIQVLISRSKSNFSGLEEKLSSLEGSALTLQQISRDVTSFNLLLHAPKLRGNFGEYLLYNLLKDSLPAKNYARQHAFSDGVKVDAVIRLGKNIIPVDSKFPMESFERYIKSKDKSEKKAAKADFIKSVKARIDEISKKYIRPQEGTFDFALMYIPSESIYYEILTGDSEKDYQLFDYAMKNRVIPVSPSTFYAYLMSIVYGLKGMKIEEKAGEIVKKLSGIQSDFRNYMKEMSVLGKHITDSAAKFKDIKDQTQDLEKKLDSLTKE